MLYIYMYPLLAVFKMSAQSIQVLYAYEFTCIWRRRHNSWVTHNCLSHNRRMSIVQTSREDKEKGLWRQQISLSCAKEVSAPLMGKLLMWPFEKVLWWCCRAKDIPRDRHGEAYQRQLRMCCKKVLDAVLHLSIVPQGSAHGSS